MDYVRKLPLLIALLSAMIVGTVGYIQKVPNRENMMKMVIVMIVFYIVGYLIRNTITGIVEANIKRAEEEEKERKRLEEEKLKEEQSKKPEKTNESTLNLVADEDLNFGSDVEDFDALPVADFIKKELNQ